MQVRRYFLNCLGAYFYRISTGRSGVRWRTLVSVPVQPADDRPKAPRVLTREEYLARGRPLPPLEETVIEDLTDEEAEAFWECIRACELRHSSTGPIVVGTTVFGARLIKVRAGLAKQYQPLIAGREAHISFVTEAELRFGARWAGSLHHPQRPSPQAPDPASPLDAIDNVRSADGKADDRQALPGSRRRSPA